MISKFKWLEFKSKFSWTMSIEMIFLYLSIMFLIIAFIWYFSDPSLDDRYRFIHRIFISIVSFGFYGILRLMRIKK